MNRLVSIMGCALFVFVALWAVGQWYRDSYWITGLLFYIPSPIVATVTLLSAVAAAWRRHWRTLLIALILAASPMWMLGWVENKLFDSPMTSGIHTIAGNGAENLTLIHWNIKGGNPRRSTSGAQRLLNELNADIFVLSDAPWITHRLKLDGMSTLQLGRMAIYASTEIQLLEDLSQGPLRSYLLLWRSRKGDIKILLGDITSSLAVHRDPYLALLNQHLNEYQADLLVGDLNSPRRSVSLSNLPSGFRHAYNVAGTGWSYTWPWPIPVYAIDNCIIGPKIIAQEYELRASRHSDHKLQRLVFTLSKQQK